MKKALAIVLALMMAFTAIQVVAFAEGEEPAKKYVKAVFAATGDDDIEAKEDLAEDLEKTGDEYKICDFNLNYGDTDDVLYFGYTYTTDEKEAITGLIIETYRTYVGSKSTINLDGVEYERQIRDLNDGAGGNYVSLYTTTSRLTGKLITDIGFKVLENENVIVGEANWETVKLFSNPDTAANLNDGTGLNYTVNMTYNSVEDTTTAELDSTFIRAIYMTKGTAKDAVDSLKATLAENAQKGETTGLHLTNLNMGTDAAYDVYIGYIFTKDPAKAITGLMFGVTDNDKENSRYAYDEAGRKYELVGENFNSGNSGKTINLYVTYEETGKVLNMLGIENNSDNIFTFSDDGKWSYIYKMGTSSKVDLNDGAGGKYIYMWQRLSDYTAQNVAQKYVKNLYVKTGDSFTAAYNQLEAELKKLGIPYNMITFNLNEGTDGKAIVLGWTYTENAEEAIADILLHHSSKDVLPDSFVKNELLYTKVDVNLNEGTSEGAYLNLYIARGENSKSLVSDIGLEMYSHFWSKSVKYFVQTDDWMYIKTFAGESRYDLNEDIGGEYAYLWYLPVDRAKKDSDTESSSDTTNTDTKASDTDNKNSDTDNKHSDTDNSDKDNTDSEKYVYGDVNRDTKVNMEDVTKIQKVLAKLDSLTKLAEKCADVTGDNKVTMEDVTTIQRYIAKLINVFPVEAKKK
ncbi:MAG: hypothetical protein K6F76_05185 [Clostridiales bacterium]|nr:hypothetical protein [Clostridiales bacterium]